MFDAQQSAFACLRSDAAGHCSGHCPDDGALEPKERCSESYAGGRETGCQHASQEVFGEGRFSGCVRGWKGNLGITIRLNVDLRDGFFNFIARLSAIVGHAHWKTTCQGDCRTGVTRYVSRLEVEACRERSPREPIRSFGRFAQRRPVESTISACLT